jgi:hypothetical protein
MRKVLIGIATLLVAVVAGTGKASAGGSPGSIGVGVEQMVYGPGGVSVVFDQGKFDVGGFLAFANDDFLLDGGVKTAVDFGGHFFYHAHSTAMSDFGVGGGLGFRMLDVRDPNADDQQELYIDLGAQIRMFLVSNVALSARLGISIGTSDVDGVALDGDISGGFGVHYFFF